MRSLSTEEALAAYQEALESVDMAVNVGGLPMKNPVTVASGTFGHGEEYADFFDVALLGAITTKGVSPHAWEGNKTPRLAEAPAGMLNSIGLQNPGVEEFCASQLSWLDGKETAVIVNVSGHTPEEYAQVIERLESEARVDAYEINISCPNVDAGGMAIGTDPKLAEQLTADLRSLTKRPLIVKLTPNVTDVTEVAKAVEAGGADAVSMINTLLGMAIDAKRRKPVLARVVGGLSGPAIKPVALRMVWQTHQAVDIPIVGMGGISSGEDAVEFMLAGASAVAVGAANFVDPCASLQVLGGLALYCKENGIAHVSDLIGALEV